jgi:hypothetical protein
MYSSETSQMVRPNTHFTEEQIRQLTTDHRFLAAVHAYSMNMFPLGEAVVRAAKERPYVPREFNTLQYCRLIQEVAELIHNKQIDVPAEIELRYPEAYAGYEARQDYYGSQAFRFYELLDPAIKKDGLQYYRDDFDEADIREIISDKRALAGIDAYRTTLTLWRLKALLYGDADAHPRDLSFDAFRRLCHAVVEKIMSGEISVPAGLHDEFPEFYASEDSEEQGRQ